MLLLGLVVGWLLRGSAGGFSQPRRQPIVNPAQATQVIAVSPLVGKTPDAEPAKVTPTDRVMNLAAMARRGLTPVVINAIIGNKLDPSFVEMFGLSDVEVAQLNASLDAANRRMTDLALGLATAQTDEESKTLSVHVPAFPDAGGVVHDQVFAAFKAALGPERYDAFSVLSANRVETAFGAFGLNDTTYIMKLVPFEQAGAGDGFYDIDKKYSSANGTYGTTHGRLMASMIADSYPVLAHFVPPALIPPKK